MNQSDKNRKIKGQPWINETGTSVLLKIEYPAKLFPVVIHNSHFQPKSEFHISIIGSEHKIMEIIRNKYDLGPEAAIGKTKEIFNHCFKKLEFILRLTGAFRLVEEQKEKSINKSIIELLEDTEAIDEFYNRLEDETEMIKKMPSHITLYTCGDPKGIGIYSEKELLQRSENLEKESLKALIQSIKYFE